MSETHDLHARLAHRKAHGAALIANEHIGFNGWLAATITKGVGSMWCAYAFAALALVSLPEAIHQGVVSLVSWISQTFLQLVLLSIIMVGQRVLASASDKQALQTFEDAEAILQMSNELHKLIEVNNKLTAEIHNASCRAADSRTT